MQEDCSLCQFYTARTRNFKSKWNRWKCFNCPFCLGYDGPLQFTMSPNNPDAMPSIQVTSQVVETEKKEDIEKPPDPAGKEITSLKIFFC